MASMSPELAEYTKFNANAGPLDFRRVFATSGGRENIPPVAPAPDSTARYRICLECAMPLETSASAKTSVCSCKICDTVEDDWLDMGGAETIFATCLGLAFLFLCLGIWL